LEHKSELKQIYIQLQFNMKLSNATLEFPRIGHWKGHIGKDELFKVAHDVKEQGWAQQKQAGIDRITVGDSTCTTVSWRGMR
jgi:Cobalamin-independent synthase, N-terminal domain